MFRIREAIPYVTNSVKGNGRNSIVHLNKIKLGNDYGHSFTGYTDLKCNYLFALTDKLMEEWNCFKQF